MNLGTDASTTVAREAGTCPRQGFEVRRANRSGHHHAIAMASISYRIALWLRHQDRSTGRVLAGNCGFRLTEEPASLVHPDVAFATTELLDATARFAPFVSGVPVLAVEILAGSDLRGDINDLIDRYLRAGVVVWLVDPFVKIIDVHRPGMVVEGFNTSQVIDANPYLPGFRVAVASIFEE